MAESPNRELSARAIGVFLCVCGAVLGFMFIYQPYAAILAGESSISDRPVPVIGAFLGVGIGLPYLVLGDRAVKVFGHPQEPKPIQFALGLALLIVGYFAYAWLKALLVAHGYAK